MSRAAILCLLLAFARLAGAQCMAPNLYTGAPQKVEEYAMPTQEYPVWAISNYDGFGNPYIVYGAAFYRLPEPMRAFTFMHQCARLMTKNQNEVAANCIALKVARANGIPAEIEEAIAKFHMGLGLLPAHMGGSGLEYWKQTAECAGPRSAPAADEKKDEQEEKRDAKPAVTG